MQVVYDGGRQQHGVRRKVCMLGQCLHVYMDMCPVEHRCVCACMQGDCKQCACMSQDTATKLNARLVHRAIAAIGIQQRSVLGESSPQA